MVFVMWRNVVMVRWLYVYMSHFMYQIDSGFVEICRGVGRGYTGVVLKEGGV
jgi:hypothetical protein